MTLQPASKAAVSSIRPTRQAWTAVLSVVMRSFSNGFSKRTACGPGSRLRRDGLQRRLLDNRAGAVRVLRSDDAEPLGEPQFGRAVIARLDHLDPAGVGKGLAAQRQRLEALEGPGLLLRRGAGLPCP